LIGAEGVRLLLDKWFRGDPAGVQSAEEAPPTLSSSGS